MARIALAAGAVAAGAAAMLVPGVGWAIGLEAISIGLSIGAGYLGRVGTAPLQDLQASSAADGAPIPIGFGVVRFGGQVIWSSGINYRTEKASSKGGNAPKTYVYSSSFAAAFGEGPGEITRLWGDSKLIYKGGQGFGIVAPWSPTATYSPDDIVSYRYNPGTGPLTELFQCVISNTGLPPPGNSLHWEQASYPFWLSSTQYQPGAEVVEPGLASENPQNALVYACIKANSGDRPSSSPSDWKPLAVYYSAPSFYPGNETQNPDPLIQGAMGATQTPAFRGLCYAVWEDFPLANFGNRIPNLRAEVSYS
jgi:hypothetical protein